MLLSTPSMRMLARAASHTISGLSIVGPSARTCVHVVPSNSQVSWYDVVVLLSALVVAPPERATRARSGSYAAPARTRAGGELGGLSCVQSPFLKTHVSPRSRVAFLVRPPNIT